MGFEETKDGGFSKPIGYSINVAKRVESNTRNGRFSRIMLSHSVSQYLRDREELKYVVQLVSAGLMSAKGVDDMSIYEVCSFKWFSDFFSFTDISPETVDSFYKEFRQNPHNVWIGNLLANIEFQKQEFRKANRIFQQLAEMEGNSAEFFNNVGVTYTLMGEESRGCLLLAEEAFSKAVSLDRFNPEYLFNMANLCYRMDRFEEAYNYSLKTLTLEREFPGAKDLNQMILITLEKHKPGIAPAQPGKEDAEADEKTGGGHLGKYFKWRD
jgi:tetratricopeptide (TPR) repeat protein